MAVYFDFKLQPVDAGIIMCMQWHNTHELLAVMSETKSHVGCVNIYNGEGEEIPTGTLQRSYPAVSFSWHPTKRVLTVGWEMGDVLVWIDGEQAPLELPVVHKSSVNAVEYNSSGNRLVTGDANGIVVVWKLDGRGHVINPPQAQHTIDQGVVQVLFKPVSPDAVSEMTRLARAAVSGDEAALEMFTWKKGKSKMMGSTDSMSFFVAGERGGVYYANDSGKFGECFIADGPVRKILYYLERNILVTVTDTLMLSQHGITADGDTKELQKVKLSGKAEDPYISWAIPGVLVTATGESIIRLWDLGRDDNYVLALDSQVGYDPTECINCVCYSPEKGTLAAGTSNGNMVTWKYSTAPLALGKKPEGEELWSIQALSILDGIITQIMWGSSKHLLAVNAVETVYILTQHVMSSHFKDQTSIIQTGPCTLSIDSFSTAGHQELRTDIQVKGVYTSQDHLAVWNGKQLVVYEISTDRSIIKAAGNFNTVSMINGIHEQNVYTVEDGKVQVRTFQGTIKQLINLTELEGTASCLDINGNYLVIGTTAGIIKVFNLSRREAKPCCNPKSVADLTDDFGGILSAKCNCNGSKVCLRVVKANGSLNPCLYIWDIELDTLQYFNLESGHGDQDDLDISNTDESEYSDEERGKIDAAKMIAGRCPASVFWDPNETKLLVVEASPIDIKDPNEKSDDSKSKKPTQLPDTMIISLFTTPENGVLLQDSFVMHKNHSSLMGLSVPFYFFVKRSGDVSDDFQSEDQAKTTPAASQVKMVSRRTMRDFVGLETADKNTRDAMMNFSYFLTIGNMDEAFKAIKLIKSESVWENMAKMCVKTRRLDVAQVCLGNMCHARGAKALREALKEPEPEVRVAVLAMQLGLNEDAERLLISCKRYDLLNDYYQASAQWPKALEIAEMHDRIHLRTTYYNYAKHLEAKGEIKQAIPFFEKSETYRFEVPRMLFEDPPTLEGYIMKTKDKSLRKWWAQYSESQGEMETALQFYEAAQDFLSLVRVHCYCGNLEKAAEICNDTGDKAACYHLARQYENQDQVKEAVHFFTRAQSYGNAIRLCKENGMEDQLMNLALLSNPVDMTEAARHYEDQQDSLDKAVMLYHKAGNFSKALDLAFRTRQFGALQLISEDLDEKTDPELLQKCADFFLENNQFDKAVDLLATGRKYWDALNLCMQQHVTITEDLCEKLTPPKDVGENEVDERIKVLEGIAEVCMQQQQYHLATKKYTQAGNKMKAMKALLKSGDTEKIIFFAGVSRQKEIYVMAANYLQSLDWRKDPEIMKNIIGFYTKGRALDSLSSFYDACAQVEIDEFQNYEKAFGALSEAYKCLTKAKMKNQSLQEEKLGSLKHRCGLIKKFLQARRVYDEDSEEAIKQCQVLVEENNLDTAVRIGDVYGFIIEHYAKKDKWKAAYSAMEEMRAKIPTVNMAYYVNIKTIESIHKALDIPLGRGIGAEKINGLRNATPDEEDGEEVEEDVDDFIDDHSEV